MASQGSQRELGRTTWYQTSDRPGSARRRERKSDGARLGNQAGAAAGPCQLVTDAAEWRWGLHPFLEVACDDPSVMCPLCFDHAWVDGVDPNLAWSQFFRENDGNRVQRSLGARIHGRIRWIERARARAD